MTTSAHSVRRSCRAAWVVGITTALVVLPLTGAVATFVEESNTKVVADGTTTAPTFGEAVSQCTGAQHVYYMGSS